MHITSTVTLVAFSTDGASALVQRSEHGPEGGGSLGFAVVSAEAPYATSFGLSSDFSPGGSSRPQRVDAKACGERAKALKQLLADKHFEKIEVNLNACSEPHRFGIVTAANNDTLTSVKLESDKGHVFFRAPAGLLDLGSGEPATTKAYLSKSRKVLVVIERDEYSTSLHGVWRASGESFEPIAVGW